MPLQFKIAPPRSFTVSINDSGGLVVDLDFKGTLQKAFYKKAFTRDPSGKIKYTIETAKTKFSTAFYNAYVQAITLYSQEFADKFYDVVDSKAGDFKAILETESINIKDPATEAKGHMKVNFFKGASSETEPRKFVIQLRLRRKREEGWCEPWWLMPEGPHTTPKSWLVEDAHMAGEAVHGILTSPKGEHAQIHRRHREQFGRGDGDEWYLEEAYGRRRRGGRDRYPRRPLDQHPTHKMLYRGMSDPLPEGPEYYPYPIYHPMPPWIHAKL